MTDAAMKEFISKCRYYLFYGFFISMFVNVLQLKFSIYMLQVYDRVLTSYSVSTLLVITIAAVICLIVLALLEWIRSRLLIRAGIEFNAVLSNDVLYKIWNRPLISGNRLGRNDKGCTDYQKFPFRQFRFRFFRHSLDAHLLSADFCVASGIGLCRPRCIVPK